jgi:hypothetical protein
LFNCIIIYILVAYIEYMYYVRVPIYYAQYVPYKIK